MNREPKKIVLLDLFGRYCIDKIDGEYLARKIIDSLNRRTPVEVNMVNVDLYTSDFIDGMVSRLADCFSVTKIKKFVEFKHTRETTKNSIEFAISFHFKYNADKKYKKEIDTEYYSLINKKKESQIDSILNSVSSILTNCESGCT